MEQPSEFPIPGIEDKIGQLKNQIQHDGTSLEILESLIDSFRDSYLSLKDQHDELLARHEKTRQRLRILGGVEKLQAFSRQNLSKDNHLNKGELPLSRSHKEGALVKEGSQGSINSWVSKRFRDLHPDSFVAGRMKRSASLTPIRTRSTNDETTSGSAKLTSSIPQQDIRLHGGENNMGGQDYINSTREDDANLSKEDSITKEEEVSSLNQNIIRTDMLSKQEDSQTSNINSSPSASQILESLDIDEMIHNISMEHKDSDIDTILADMSLDSSLVEMPEKSGSQPFQYPEELPKPENNTITPPNSPSGQTNSSLGSSQGSSTSLHPSTSSHLSPRSQYYSGDVSLSPRLETLIASLVNSSNQGLQEKLELEKIRKAERMKILSPPKQPSKPELKRKRSFKSSKNFLLTSPRNFKLVSQKSETDEMERIFYMAKDFIEKPKYDREEELRTMNEKTKERIQIAKESLSFTINLSECELQSIPNVVNDLFRKTKSLDLSNNLLPTVPQSIGTFDMLHELILSSNNISSISPSILRLVHLKVLVLDNNKLSNILSEIGYLVNLEVLDISKNSLSDLPRQIGHLVNLKSLNIGHNNKIDSLPREIGHLEKLMIFESPYCSISKIIKEFCCLLHLQFVDFSHNIINEISPYIGRLVKLSMLDLSDNDLKELPTSLTFCKELCEGGLDLRNNPLDPRYGSSTKEIFDYLDKNRTHMPMNIDIPLPHKLNMPRIKQTYDNENVYTLQEKMTSLWNWCSETIQTYLQPALLEISKSTKQIESLDDNKIDDIEQILRQIKAFTKRNEDSLPKIKKDSIIEWKKENNPITQLKSFILNELLIIEKIIQGCEEKMKELTKHELVNDIAQIVYIVHYIRELLFILVLRK